ncbi:MAG: family 20 glycosylhydrolase [Planctomycetota bacterium]|nr:MAG: family 20 glycosylhydrolase [Planctomycetota bacterium]
MKTAGKLIPTTLIVIIIVPILQAQPGSSPIGNLIPKPKSCITTGGVCNLSIPAAFNLPEHDRLSEKTVRLTLGKIIHLAPKPSTQPPAQGLQLLIGNPGVPGDSPEAYSLRAEQNRIVIMGKTGEGILNGLRTLAQLAIDGPIPQCEINDAPDFSMRGAHLCYHLIRESLAYNVPNFQSLLSQIDRLASMKVNTVLLELESMFPYQKHKKISCKIAFTPDQINQLRDRLDTHHIQIIPLVQCLGHAYNVLTHDEYAEYRELPDYIQQYCPTNPKVIDLYMEFVDEYLQFFPHIKQWHLGGDESRMLGRCPRCKAKEKELGRSRLYVDHVGEIARRVAAKGITPMLWSDMMEHHPEAMDLLPTESLKIVYWNYDLPTWPRGYAAPMFINKGFKVIGSPGIRFGGTGTELSVYYPRALRGLESLIPRMYCDGCREIITTNWMKGSPHESTEYGSAYAAALMWNKSISRADFQSRYAGLTFGLADPGICNLHETLSLWLPYAEPVKDHMPNHLDRFDLSGLPFSQKWQRYTKPGNETKVLQQLKDGLTAAEQTLKILEQLHPRCSRGKRYFDIIELSAECIKAKARLALALHRERHLEQKENADTDILRWSSEIPAIIGAWKAAKEKHHRMLLETGFKPCIDFVNELMFEPAEVEFLEKMGRRLAGKISEGKKPSQVAVAFLDNPGPPYKRGFVHGSTFKEEISQAIEKWCRGMKTASPYRLELKNRMFSYTLQNFPYIIEELQGIADGSGKSLDEIFWLNIFNAVGRIRPLPACSSVIRRGTDQNLYLGKTSDTNEDQRKMMLLRRVRYNGRDFYVVGWVGTVWVEMALTSTGLAIGGSSAPSQPGQTGEGIGQHLGAYPVLFQADNVEQAIETLTRIKFAGKGKIFGLADAVGNAAILEKTGTAQGVIRIRPQQIGILGVNDYQTPHMRQYNSERSEAMLRNCQNRRDAFDRWLSTTTGADGLKSVTQFLSDNPFCQTGQANMYTLSAAIISPVSREMRLTGLPPSKKKYVTWRFID